MTKNEMNKIQNAISEMSKHELLDTLFYIIDEYSLFADKITQTDIIFNDKDENTFFHSLADTLMNFETALDERELDIEDL